MPEMPIQVYPRTYDVEQRIAASKEASRRWGCGVIMEIGTFKTRYYSSDRVPLGKVLVRVINLARTDFEDVLVLDRPEENFDLSAFPHVIGY